MSEVGRLLQDTTDRLFGDACTPAMRAAAERGEWPARLWQEIVEAGLTTPFDLADDDTALADAMIIMRGIGRHAAPVPLAEAILGSWLLTRAGLPSHDGPVTVAPPANDGALPVLSRVGAGWSLSGCAREVPWAHNAAVVVVVAAVADGGGQAILALPMDDAVVIPAVNTAAEPRDHVVFKGVPVAASGVGRLPEGDAGALLVRLGALARCHQMAGAMEWILERCCGYAGERRQFGRPIGGFQAVQQLIAMMAGEASAANTAADAAARSHGMPDDDWEIGLAKARVGAAAGHVATLAHQVHGAMGYSHEYPLHFRTRRLWAWRDEFGSERFWQISTGRRIARRGGAMLWQNIT